MDKQRGFFGIGIWGPQHDCNVGTLFRSAVAFGASFIFTVGRKYSRTSADTVNSPRHIPYYRHLTGDDLIASLPSGCKIVCVEITDKSYELPEFCHPETCVYLLGNEGNGIPEKFMQDKLVVEIPTRYCLNVATAGSIVLYDRVSKQLTKDKYGSF